jgi:chloramphenicol-sensitive protein RarD
VAVAVASAGVLWLAVQTGQVPWIALALALSFGFYGLLRKVAVLGALEGLTLETVLLAPVALVVLGVWAGQGQGALVSGDGATLGWLVLAGPITAIPLLLFAAGARRIPLATMGLLQYISPSLQLALGVWLFHEPFDPSRLVGFALIWVALLVYTLEGWYIHRRRMAD